MPSRRHNKRQKDGRRIQDGRMGEVLDGLLSNIDFEMMTEMDDDVGVDVQRAAYTPTGSSTSKEYVEYNQIVEAAIQAEITKIKKEYASCISTITSTGGTYTIAASVNYTPIKDLLTLIETLVSTGATVDTTSEVDALKAIFVENVASHIMTSLDLSKSSSVDLKRDLMAILSTAFDKIKPDVITATNAWVSATQTYLKSGITRGTSQRDIKKDYNNVSGSKLPKITEDKLKTIHTNADLYVDLYKLYDQNIPFFPDGSSRARNKSRRSDGRGKKYKKKADGRSKRKRK